MKTWAIDTIERAAFTAAETFLAVWVVTDSSTATSAAIAAVAAAAAVIKAALASRRTGTISPAGAL